MRWNDIFIIISSTCDLIQFDAFKTDYILECQRLVGSNMDLFLLRQCERNLGEHIVSFYTYLHIYHITSPQIEAYPLNSPWWFYFTIGIPFKEYGWSHCKKFASFFLFVSRSTTIKTHTPFFYRAAINFSL